MGHPAVSPSLLGAQRVGPDAWFGVAAPEADALTLHYWPDPQREVRHCVQAQRSEAGIWQACIPRAASGLHYAWQALGPHNPSVGHRFDPNLLLLDPYAQSVTPASAPGHPPLLARLTDSLPRPQPGRARVEAGRRVLYEAHVKGLTALHPEVPADQRGRYLGMTHPSVVSHLLQLGITTVSLMPLAARLDEVRLQSLGLTNYWGYNPIAWMAPEPRYASCPELAPQECLAMVDGLHQAGLEVILDVVFNHSAESDHLGPNVSLKGLGNRRYYRLEPEDASRYVNWAGCGNVLDLREPLVLRLVLDSLRHWVCQYGVDGFRFDLASTLGRTGSLHEAPRLSEGFFSAIAQDPILRDCVLIAEPWDLGPHGYQLGQFPANWLEWNDQFRDTQRSVWLNRGASLAELASTVSGSRTRFGSKAAHCSVNFVAAHDGFTLTDLTQFNEKHNEANGEQNRDGHSNNHSHNFGEEGPSLNPDRCDLRDRARRSLATVCLLSLGTPMWRAGDELGQTQQGNNNAYCQDNPITWIDWSLAEEARAEFLRFCQALGQLRSRLPLLQAHQAWTPETATWQQPDGLAMQAEDWHAHPTRGLALTRLNLQDGSALWWAMNPTPHALNFVLPEGSWMLALDTAHPSRPSEMLQHRETVSAGCIIIGYTRIHKHI